MMILLHIIQSMILVDASLVVPDACSTTKLVCVGEGQPCLYDQESSSTSCDNPLISHCRVCSGEGLRCYAGTCIRLLAGEGEYCSTSSSNRNGCRAGLTCQANQCVDLNAVKPIIRLGRGEVCDPRDDKCISSLQCDVNRRCAWPFCTTSINQRCDEGYDKDTCEMMTSGGRQCIWRGIDTNFVMDSSVQTYSCSNDKNCLFGDYCAPSKTCLPGIPYGGRLGATCRSEDSIGDEQCGVGMKCVQKNPFMPKSHVDFNTLHCQWKVGPFDKGEGERCSSSDDCGKNLLCDTVCTSADYTHLGQGCGSTSECGRGLICSCPRMGDDTGRERCVLAGGFDAHNKDVDDFNNLYRPFIQCWVQNKCRTDYCLVTKCKAQSDAWNNRGKSSKLCQAAIGLDTYIEAAAYKGVPVIGGEEGPQDIGWPAAALVFLFLLLVFSGVCICQKFRPPSNKGSPEAVGLHTTQ